MLQQNILAKPKKDASLMKAYLEYLVRNLSKLGVPGKGLDILRGRFFAVNLVYFPGKETPSAFLSFNMTDRDTRRFIHHPGSDSLVPISQAEAMANDTSFFVLASTDRETSMRLANAYLSRMHPLLRKSVDCRQGENIIIEDGFANKKGESAPKSVLLFTVVINILPNN